LSEKGVFAFCFALSVIVQFQVDDQETALEKLRACYIIITITQKFRIVVNFTSYTQVLPMHARFDGMNYGIILLDSLMIKLLVVILSYCCSVFAKSHWPEDRVAQLCSCPAGAPAGSIYFVQFVRAQVNDKINPPFNSEILINAHKIHQSRLISDS
jgi:hypothetical protein